MIMDAEAAKEIQIESLRMNRELFHPEDTSVSQISHAIKYSVNKGYVSNGDVVLDYGGGKYDKGTEYYKEHGIVNLVYDIYARPTKYNLDVLTKLSDVYHNVVDCVILANVLCVIPFADEREHIIKHAYSFLKKNKSMLVTVYECDKNNIGKVIASCGRYHWQECRKTLSYVDEIKMYINGNCEIKRNGDIIVVTKL